MIFYGYSLVPVLQRLAEGVVLYSIADDDELAVAHDLAITHYPISIIRTNVLKVGFYIIFARNFEPRSSGRICVTCKMG